MQQFPISIGRMPNRTTHAPVSIGASTFTWPTVILCALALLASIKPAAATSECASWRALDGSCKENRYGLGYAQQPPDTTPPLWAGAYLGLDIGGATGGVATNGLTSGDIEVSGLIGGAHAGYNVVFDNMLLGFEFDLMRSGTDGDRAFQGGMDITSDVDWLSSGRMRLGYASGNYLFYATGGLAFARQELQLQGPSINVSDHNSLVGYALGGGVEMKVMDGVSARIEAIHYGFGEQTFDVSTDTLEADADVTTIRAGLSMHFN